MLFSVARRPEVDWTSDASLLLTDPQISRETGIPFLYLGEALRPHAPPGQPQPRAWARLRLRGAVYSTTAIISISTIASG